VWAWSVSRGSEKLGLVATHWPNLLQGLIDESGRSVVNQSFDGDCPATALSAWTVGGHVVPYDTASGTTGLSASLARPAMIPFNDFRGPVLMVSGADDQVWPSNRYENIIMGELQADPAPHIHLNYADPGHADVGPPYPPSSSSTTTMARRCISAAPRRAMRPLI
jgi:hypothetical protein